MALPQTYSRRKRIRDQEGKTLELRTSPFGQKLLNQIFSAFQVIDHHLGAMGEPLFRALVAHTRTELGVPALSQGKTFQEEFYWWWLSENQFGCPNHDYRLDAIEIACVWPFEFIRELSATEPEMAYRPAQEISRVVRELNARMAEDGFGYRFENGQVIEVTSEYLYDTAIAPVLGLTSDEDFAAVDQEFRDALAELRADNFDDCIADCGNALESTLKVIADKKQWPVKPNDRAASLINMAFEQQLIPGHLQSQFTGLRSVIQGIPTMRNNEGGHGAGINPRVVEKYFAEYMVQQTAAAILFLIRAAD
jgi:hypothetical protein